MPYFRAGIYYLTEASPEFFWLKEHMLIVLLPPFSTSCFGNYFMSFLGSYYAFAIFKPIFNFTWAHCKFFNGFSIFLSKNILIFP